MMAGVYPETLVKVLRRNSADAGRVPPFFKEAIEYIIKKAS